MALSFSEADGDGEDSVVLTLAQAMLALAVVAATALALHWLGSGSEQDKEVAKQSPESKQTQHPQDREMVHTPIPKVKVSCQDQEPKASEVTPDAPVPSPREQPGRSPEDPESPRGKEEGLVPPATPRARAPKITSRVAPPKQPGDGSQPSCSSQSKAGVSPGPLLIHFTPRHPETWSEEGFGVREQLSLLGATPAGEKPDNGQRPVGQRHEVLPSPRTRSRIRGPGPDPFTLGTVVSVWDAIDAESSLAPGRLLPQALGTRISAPAPEDKWVPPSGQDTTSSGGSGEGPISQGQSKPLASGPLPTPMARGLGLPVSGSPDPAIQAPDPEEGWPWKERELLLASSFSRPPHALIRQLVASDQGSTLPIRKETAEAVLTPRQTSPDLEERKKGTVLSLVSPGGTSPGQTSQPPSTSPGAEPGALAKPGGSPKKGPENNLSCCEEGDGDAQGPGLSPGPSPRARKTLGSLSPVSSPGVLLPPGSPTSAPLPTGPPSSVPSLQVHSPGRSPSSELLPGPQSLGPSSKAASSPIACAPTESPSSAPVPSGSPFSDPTPKGSPASILVPTGSPISVPASKGSLTAAPTGSPTSAPAPSGSPSPTPAPKGSLSPAPVLTGSSISTPASKGSCSVPAPSGSLFSTPAPTVDPSSAPVSKVPEPKVSPSSAPPSTVSPSSAPVPTVSPSSAPTPTVSPSSAPAPIVSPSSAPASIGSSSLAPAPSGSSSSVPVFTVSPSSAPASTVPPFSAPAPSGSSSSAPIPTVAPSSGHASTGAPLPTTSSTSGLAPKESFSSAVSPRALTPTESPSSGSSPSIPSSTDPPSSLHIHSTASSSIAVLSAPPSEPLPSAPIAPDSLIKDQPSVALPSPTQMVQMSQNPSEAEGLTESPGPVSGLSGGPSKKALSQGPNGSWGNLISMVLRSHPFPSPEKPQGEAPQSSPEECPGPVPSRSSQTGGLPPRVNIEVLEPQAKDQPPSKGLETPGAVAPSTSRSLSGTQMEEERLAPAAPQSAAQGPLPAPGQPRLPPERKPSEPMAPREGHETDGQPAPRPRKRSICQVADSLAQKVSPAAPAQREIPAGLVAPLTERQLQDSQLMAFLRRPGTWGTVEGQRKPSQPPKDLPGTVAAMRRNLDLGSCVEALAFAQQHGEVALAEEVYALMSDNLLLVLGDTPLYRQLGSGDRQRILALRTSRGRAVLGVLELPSSYGGSRSGLAGGSQAAEVPMAASSAGPRTYLHMFEPGRNAWLPLTLVPEEAPLRGCGLCTMNNYLFLAGGIRGSGPGAVCTNEVFCYNPLTDIWTQVRPMLQARAQLKLVALEGLLYAIGGECLYSMECYDPRTDHWASRAPLPAGTFPVAHEAVACRGDIYVTGGHLFYRLLKYSPLQDCWVECPYSASHRRSSDMVALGGFLYRFDLLRGVGAAVMRFNTVTGSWSQAAPLPLPEPIPLRCAVLGNTIYCLNQQVTATFTVSEGTAQFEARELKPFPMAGKGILCPFTLTVPALGPLQTPL